MFDKISWVTRALYTVYCIIILFFPVTDDDNITLYTLYTYNTCVLCACVCKTCNNNVTIKLVRLPPPPPLPHTKSRTTVKPFEISGQVLR